MILDSSAVVAILRLEPEARAFATAIEKASVVRISGATMVETALVLGSDWDVALDRTLAAAGARIEAVTPEQARMARIAHRRFGRGTGHPAKLNFGDCFSYALAMDKAEPLLFKGDDFGHTDVTPAV